MVLIHEAVALIVVRVVVDMLRVPRLDFHAAG